MAASLRRTAAVIALLSGGLVAGAIACGFDGVGSVSGGANNGGADGSGGPGTNGDGGPLPGTDGAPGTEDASGDGADASTACTLDAGGTGILCGAECVDPARNRQHCGSCNNGCNVTSACEGSCVAVASALDGLRYELPCLDAASPFCDAGPAPAAKMILLTGTTGKSYVMTIRVRGVVEQKTYNGEMSANATGTNAAFFVAGGSPANDLWNAYSLQIASPPKNFGLNGGASNHTYVDAIDYTADITVAAGTAVKLGSSSSDDLIVRNQDQANSAPIVIPNIKPAPQAFNGQFVQIDVKSVSLTP